MPLKTKACCAGGGGGLCFHILRVSIDSLSDVVANYKATNKLQSILSNIIHDFCHRGRMAFLPWDGLHLATPVFPPLPAGVHLYGWPHKPLPINTT